MCSWVIRERPSSIRFDVLLIQLVIGGLMFYRATTVLLLLCLLSIYLRLYS